MEIKEWSSPPEPEGPPQPYRYLRPLADELRKRVLEWAEVTGATSQELQAIRLGNGPFAPISTFQTSVRGKGEAQRHWVRYLGPVDENGLSPAEQRVACEYCRAEPGEACSNRRHIQSYGYRRAAVHARRIEMFEEIN